MVPLIEVKADGGFEGRQDSLREIQTRLAISQPRSVIGDLRKDMRRIPTMGARQVDGQ